MNKKRFLLVIALLLPLALAIWSVLIEPRVLVRREENLASWGGAPLRIVFFSDLHAGSLHIDQSYIATLVERINAEAPDLILIGGDLLINGVVGGRHTPIEVLAPQLKLLRANYGVYAVLGNHDWWNDGDNIRQHLEANGIPVLDNDAHRISHAQPFWLVGIGDSYTDHADPAKALANVLAHERKILFMHDPAAIFGVKSKYDVAFAGHLHGGQVYIPGIGALGLPGDAPRAWASGYASFAGGEIFISRGVGTSILPIRFNALPEFVVMNLGSNGKLE